jgi:hypothetical protein
MSPIEFRDDDILIDGVPSKQFVGALKAAGLSDEAVTALLAEALARATVAPAGAERATVPEFQFQTAIAETAPECAATYSRGFFHPDFFDGLTVVQAGQTPEELGFNFRFHKIEDEFDAVGGDLFKLSNCLAELRREVFGMARELEAKITEIDALLKAKPKEKEGKDTKEKDIKEFKEKEFKEGKDKEKEGKDGKDKEKDQKDGKEKERKEAIDKALPQEKVLRAEKTIDLSVQGPTPPADAAPSGEPTDAAPSGEPEQPAGSGQTFIRPEERPAVGDQALDTSDDE